MGYFVGGLTPTPSGGGAGYRVRYHFTPPSPDTASQPKPYDAGAFAQRPDLNKIIGEGANIAVGAGRAPGYIAERPFAWLNTATKGPGADKGFVDEALDTIRSIPVAGPILGGVGDFLSTSWVQKFGNAPMANALAATYGMPDDAPIPDSVRAGFGPPALGIPVLSQLFQIGELLHGTTVGEIRADAAARGFTREDIEDLAHGRKGMFDFEHAAVDANPLANLAYNLAFDPTNLAFGAGAAAKIPFGFKALDKFFQIAGKSKPLAYEAWTAGRNLATDWHLVPYKGFASAVAGLARGTSYAEKGYRATAPLRKGYLAASVGLTATELGVTAVSKPDDNSPISALLEPLADFARRAQSDEPLSKNVLFSLVAALKFPYHDTVQAARGRWAAVRYNATGSGIIPAVVRELAPDQPTFKGQMRQAAEDFGGEQHVYQFAEWAIRDIAAERVHRYWELIKPDTQAGMDAFAAWSDRETTRLAKEAMQKGDISPAQVVERMKEIATNARQIADASSGVRFPFIPRMVGKVFTDWRLRVSELAQMFNNRSPVVLKMLQDMPLPLEHVQILRGSLDTLAELNGGMVPRRHLTEMLHDYPQLLRDEPFKTALSRYIIRDGPESVAVKEVTDLLKQYEKAAKPLSDYLWEFRDWESRWNVTQPRVRSFDPATRRWSKDAAVPVGEVRVIAPSYLGGRARSAGLKAQGLDDVAALRGDALGQWFESESVRGADKAGFNVESSTQSIMYDAARGELLPHQTINLKSEPKAWSDAGKLGVALVEAGSRKIAGQANYFIREMTARTARSMGVNPNAIRFRWQFGELNPAQADALARLSGRVGGHFDDYRSAFELWVKDSDLDDDLIEQVARAVADAVPSDPALGRLLPESEPVYFERVANDARPGNTVGADEVLSNVRREAATDPRYVAAATYYADTRRAAGVPSRPRSTSARRQWKPSAAGVQGEAYSAAARQRVADSWSAVEAAHASGADVVPAVDRFLADLHDNVAPTAIPDALADLRSAVETRFADNPLPPALDDALLRAHEDLVATGGNMGQVLFNAKLDAAADSILPVFDKSLAEAPLELKQRLAGFQRNLVLEKPAYTVSLPPKGDLPLIWSNEVGKVVADYMKPRRQWVQDLFDKGPISRAAQFQRMLFEPRKSMAAADATKQSLYNVFLQFGAKVNEVNGYIDALRRVSELFEIRGVKLFRSFDALPPSVYEKIALGKKGSASKGPFRIEFDASLVGFNGFGDEVIQKVGAGNFWKLIDMASSQWWRGATEAAAKGGVQGRIGRQLTAIYPKGMGIRHAAKVWYHVFRFLVDPRWWLMNEAEAQVMLGLKHGVNVKGAAGTQPSTMAKFHLRHGRPASEAELALDAAASGWYDNRRMTGAIVKTFDADAPRSTMRMLESLPESDPIIKMMIEKHGLSDVNGSWGQQLIDDIEALDTRGVEATVVGEAQKMWAADEYARMEQSGVLQRVYDLNKQRMDDLERTLHGNPDRSLMERVLNSYWLYWPISYQLKAGKWLYDVLTHRMFGAKTNLGGAYMLSHMIDIHERLMREDPGYVAMFEDNPTTWFFAQMFVPITPFDLSISLSPAGKALGGLAGLWEPPTYASDPFAFAARLATIGPTLTRDLMGRVASEQDPLDFVLRPFNEPAQ